MELVGWLVVSFNCTLKMVQNLK